MEAGNDTSPAAVVRRRRMLRVWWLWLPLGIALIVYGIVSGSNLVSRGGPFVIGCILLMWGVLGGIAWLARRRRPWVR
jgi:uncharacterized membrane protein HdeD (DUF308 family)